MIVVVMFAHSDMRWEVGTSRYGGDGLGKIRANLLGMVFIDSILLAVMVQHPPHMNTILPIDGFNAADIRDDEQSVRLAGT